MIDWRLLVFLILAALAPIGCGGDNDSGSEPATTPATTQTEPVERMSKQEFIDKADAVCGEYDREVARIPGENSEDPKEVAQYARGVAEAAKGVYDELSALPKPSGDEKILTEYLETARDQIGLLRRAAEAYDDGDVLEAQSVIESGQGVGERLTGIANGYGFRECGSGD